MTPVVILEKLKSGFESLQKQFERSFDSLGLCDDFKVANAILIKPNLTFSEYQKGVTTQKKFVESFVAALRQINSTTTIYIGEGEGGYNSFSMTDAMKAMGFFDLERIYPNVKILNLSKLPSCRIQLEANGRPYFVEVPGLFLDEIDFSITCPLPKVHCMTKLTLAFKNQWGCLSDIMRLKNHYVFDQIIWQICRQLKFKYAFLDGKYGLDDNGPMRVTPKIVDWFVAANSLGAFDVVVSGMMGFDWQQIGHIRQATRSGYAPSRNQIKIIGDPEALRKNFALNRTFWNYPALAAFKSKHLTHLFYFSMFAKPLHDVMYIFRKKAIP